MSYTDTRADRPLTRRRYPSNSNNSTSEVNYSRLSSGALIPVPQPYPATSSGANNTTAEMDRYMAYMDLGQLLEHNMEALFPAAADELLTNHEAAVAGEHSAAYRNYLMEIEDASARLIGGGGPQLFTPMPAVDMRSHRSSGGNSRILRNFVIMDGRNNNNNQTIGLPTRKPPMYHNNFPIFGNTAGSNEDTFLCNFETKPSADPFTVFAASTNQLATIDDIVHLNPRWQATVPCKYKLDEVFEEYRQKEMEEELDENQRNFARELFFAAMFYVDEEDEDRKNRNDDTDDGDDIGQEKKKPMLLRQQTYW